MRLAKFVAYYGLLLTGYLLVCFVKLEWISLNPTDWEAFSRLFVGLFVLFSLADIVFTEDDRI